MVVGGRRSPRETLPPGPGWAVLADPGSREADVIVTQPAQVPGNALGHRAAVRRPSEVGGPTGCRERVPRRSRLARLDPKAIRKCWPPMWTSCRSPQPATGCGPTGSSARSPWPDVPSVSDAGSTACGGHATRSRKPGGGHASGNEHYPRRHVDLSATSSTRLVGVRACSSLIGYLRWCQPRGR